MGPSYDIAPQLPTVDINEVWLRARDVLRRGAAGIIGALSLEQTGAEVLLAEKKKSDDEEDVPDPHAGPASKWEGVVNHDPGCTALACTACARAGRR